MKWCTQYASKFVKLSSGHGTRKGQFSFQSQRKAIPKKAQTIPQLHSSHTLAKLWLQFCKLGENSTWTENFQKYKLDLKKRISENIYFSFIGYAKAFGCLNYRELWKIFQEMRIPNHLTYLLRNLYGGQEATVRTGHGTMDWFHIGKGVCQGYILLPCLYNL